jgi:hypothetical protein
MTSRSAWVGLVAVGLVLGPPAVSQVADREKIIDITELREAMKKAAEPMARRIESTTLKDRFTTVAELLQSEEPDKQALLDALRALRNEINTFTDGWSEVEEPLWLGQESIGRTIDRVRLLLARSATEEPSAEAEALLSTYDRRLSDLAAAIKREPDEVRKRRLKSLFANTLSLRKLVDVYGRIDFRPASQTMLGQLVKALMHLEDQLTTATFQVERARIVLGQTGEFISGYVAIVEDLVEAEELARMLADMQSHGAGMGALSSDLTSLTSDVESFTQLMESFMVRIAAQIESEAQKLAGTFKPMELEGVDIDAEIERYFALTAPKPAGTQ